MSTGDGSRARRTFALAGLAFASASCALSFTDYELREETTGTSTSAGDVSAVSSGSGGAAPVFVASTCAPGTFATGVTPEGKLTCATIDAATVVSVNEACAIYAGWRPGCAGCTDAPDAWGKVGAAGCDFGAGTSNLCPMPMLDGATVSLLGLDTVISAIEGDKFYYGFTCDAGSTTTQAGPAGPCAEGEWLQGYDGVSTTCVPASGAILSYVRDQCSLYVGWTDDCYQECVLTPERWGRVNTKGCDPGPGDVNTCITLDDGGVGVQLLGLSTYGLVDYTDEFYTGLACLAPTPVTDRVPGACPSGQFVVEVFEDGTLRCESPAGQIAQAFGDRCTLYSGWDASLMNDQPPQKWGRVRSGDCNPDAGDGSACYEYTMGGVDVQTFRLKAAGFGGGQFFTGFACAGPPIISEAH